jgi:hypothetical protein
MSQAVEGYNFLPLAQKAMTLSFWHKHTKTGTYCVSLRNSGLDRSYVAEYTQAVTDTWELTTITITASPSAGTWLYTTGVGLWVDFTVLSGSTFQTTANAWQTGNFSATANQVNGLDNTANNFRIALVQLEAGSVATEFESRMCQDELALCLRYAWVWNSDADSDVFVGGCGAAYSTTAGIVAIQFPVRMRALPTVSVSAAGDFVLTTGTANNTPTSIIGEQVNLTSGRLNATGGAASLTANDATMLTAGNANARMTFASEL